jgi:hypothetical protein
MIREFEKISARLRGFGNQSARGLNRLQQIPGEFETRNPFRPNRENIIRTWNLAEPFQKVGHLGSRSVGRSPIVNIEDYSYNVKPLMQLRSRAALDANITYG